MRNKELNVTEKYNRLPSKRASQILWSTGSLSEPLPNGFYCVVPEKKLKELYEDIPTLEDLRALELEGLRTAVILVDAEKDKKILMLKQLIVPLVKGLNRNPAAMIKKIAGLVSDFYKRPSLGQSPKKDVLEESLQVSENRGVQMLGQIKNGSCRPRAVLFKVLADAVGLESRLVVGLPSEGDFDCLDSYNHMSVMVVLNSVELLVDLIRFPGQLIPQSSKAIFMTHVSAAGESDSAENDSCDSPMEPNSPLYGVPEINVADRLESSSNAAGPSLRNMMLANSIDMKLSLSHSEPSVASTFWRRSHKKIIPNPRTASSRAVRAMNESLKLNQLSRDQGESGSHSSGYNDQHDASQSKDHISQKAMSLPSSPHEFRSQTTEGRETSRQNEDMVSTWNRVLELPAFQKNPLLPFEEWNISFSELNVGTRVGIGFFGEIFRGVWNGTEVAIKVFLEQDLTAENMEDFCNEISILSRLRHPNVILFLGACTNPPRLSMVTEYMEMGSLYYLIHSSGQKKKLSWRRRIKMLRDICRGMMCIHRMMIVHRDLKSANCLVNKNWTVKICDFGLSKFMTDVPMKDSSSAGTPEWMAPELIRNEPFTEKCDIFSLGVIMWELCTLSKPWDRIPPEQVVYAVANEGSRLEIPEGPLGRLIADCWAEPHLRPSCEDILASLLDCELAIG